jgi:DNA (cytosine-5)-methyltransferase 1
MRKKYKLLDLFCGAGGCSMGYFMSGFDVTGIDIKEQVRYPFKFIKGDAFDIDLNQYDVIHASPPCQGYSITKHIRKNEGKCYDYLIEKTREFLKKSGKLYVIENVNHAPLINPLMLSGNMFGLKVKRVRLFESNIYLIRPSQYYLGGIVHKKIFDVTGNSGGTIQEWREAMGVNWMIKKEITQAVPPVYTDWVGTQLINYLMLNQLRVNVEIPGLICQSKNRCGFVEPAAR